MVNPTRHGIAFLPGTRNGYALATERMRADRSRYGSVALPAKISDAVRRRGAFRDFPQHRSLSEFLVTSPECDGITSTPEYKRTAVRIEKLA